MCFGFSLVRNKQTKTSHHTKPSQAEKDFFFIILFSQYVPDDNFNKKMLTLI